MQKAGDYEPLSKILFKFKNPVTIKSILRNLMSTARDYIILGVLLILIIVLLIFIIKRNNKDRKKFERDLNQSEIKPEQHSDNEKI